MKDLTFTIPEILSLIGAVQCTYVMVYVLTRSGNFARAILPAFYFLVLCIAFLTDFANSNLHKLVPYYAYIQWAAWFSGPPISVLLVVQIAQITKTPDFRHYWVLLLIPLAFISALVLTKNEPDLQESMLIVTGLVAGGVSLLTIWANRGLFSAISKEKIGKSRYWLILTLIFTNICFLAVMLSALSDTVPMSNVIQTRTILGLGFVYLVSTSLFRIYPQAVQLKTLPASSRIALSEENLSLIQKIERLMTLDKVYQEPTYSRTDLARECNVSESLISKVINEHFQKSLPQLLNEYRIEDAIRLLSQTAAPVSTIAKEVGFNSLPSFNRAFKDVSGVSPSEYRKAEKR
jgi:AraC-like DNA-binding protein